MSQSLFAIVKSHAHLNEIVLALEQIGFSSDDITAIIPDQHSSHALAHEQKSKAPEGAVAGGLTGASVGGIVGLLAGLGSLAIPGLGILIAAGPILAALSGAAVGAAAGGMTGSLIGLGIPEYEAKRYESRLTAGGILLSVHVENKEETKRARTLLKDMEATDIALSSESAVPAENKERMNKEQDMSRASLAKVQRDDDRPLDSRINRTL